MVARVIAIDGPSASGKSSVAARVAVELGCPYVSTGSMYRAVAWLAAASGVTSDNVSEALLAPVLAGLDLKYVKDASGGFVLQVNGGFPADELRGPAVSALSSLVSAFPIVREKLTAVQRQLADGRWLVMEGRDIGSVVFPDAAIKFFLTASPLERARRRLAQEGGRSLEEVAAEIAARDLRDTLRPISPLKIADGAKVVDSTGLSLDETVAKMVELATRHDTPYRVSYGDTDQMGVVYYANYLEMWERGRTEMLRSVGLSYRELEAMGAFLPVAEVRIRYAGSAHYDDLLTVRTRVLAARGARLVIESRILRNEELLVDGEVTLCCVDAARRVRRLPEELVAACSVYRVRGEAR